MSKKKTDLEVMREMFNSAPLKNRQLVQPIQELMTIEKMIDRIRASIDQDAKMISTMIDRREEDFPLTKKGSDLLYFQEAIRGLSNSLQLWEDQRQKLYQHFREE